MSSPKSRGPRRHGSRGARSRGASAKPPAPPSGPLVTLTIDHVGGQGDGVASYDGDRVYVPLTVAGDVVEARLGERKSDAIRSALERVITPGPGRREPACRHFGICGGCVAQHMDDHAYTEWKLDGLARTLDRAGLGTVPVAPLARVPLGGRRRARFVAIRRADGVVLGFNARQSHQIIDLAACPVTRAEIVALLPALRGVLAAVLAPRETVDVSVTSLDGGLDVCLIGALELNLEARERLASFAEAADVARLSWREDDTYGAEPVVHRRDVSLPLGGLAVAPPPGGFLQAAAEGAEALTAVVVGALAEAVPDGARVADLFCGVGTFTLPLAERLRVAAVDGDGDAVGALESAVRRSGARVETRRRDLFRDPLRPDEMTDMAAVVLDPPRAGASAQCVELAKSSVGVVVMVSCDPSSFARDARTLVAGGYRPVSIHPVDQFLWSAHLELAGVFHRG